MSQLFTMGEVQAYFENEQGDYASFADARQEGILRDRQAARNARVFGGSSTALAVREPGMPGVLQSGTPSRKVNPARTARNKVPRAGRGAQRVKKGVGEMVQYTTRSGKKAFRKVGLYAKRGGRMVMKGAKGGGNLVMKGARGGANLTGQGASALGKNIGRYPGRYGAAVGIAAAGAGGYYLSGRD